MGYMIMGEWGESGRFNVSPLVYLMVEVYTTYGNIFFNSFLPNVPIRPMHSAIRQICFK